MIAVGRLRAQCLEERNVIGEVQFEVAQGVLHRGEVADLAGEVEHEVASSHRRGDLPRADGALEHLDLETVDVATVSAVFGHQGIDHDDVSAFGYETVHERRADESEPTGDHTASAVEGPVIERSGIHGVQILRT